MNWLYYDFQFLLDVAHHVLEEALDLSEPLFCMDCFDLSLMPASPVAAVVSDVPAPSARGSNHLGIVFTVTRR